MKLARFTGRVVSLARNAVVGELDPAFEGGDAGYAVWVGGAIHCLRESLYHPYRRLLNVVHGRDGIATKIALMAPEIPDFTFVRVHEQDRKMRIRRVLFRLSAELHDIPMFIHST